jgi:hypothetical protein
MIGLAADARVAVRYAGDAGCDGPAARVERSTDGGRTWHAVRTRVAHPTAVAVASPYVLVTGRDAGCGWLTEYSADHGARYTAASSVLDAAGLAIGAFPWAISSRGELMRGDTGLVTAQLQPGPCPQRSGPAFISAYVSTVWVVCRGVAVAGGETREVRATYDGGANWVTLAGSIGGRDGLDGRGRIDGFGFTDAEHGWALLRGTGRCGDDADLRVTGDRGRTWTALPCVPATLAPNVLTAAFADPLHALLLTAVPGGLRTVVTADGGATWRVAGR